MRTIRAATIAALAAAAALAPIAQAPAKAQYRPVQYQVRQVRLPRNLTQKGMLAVWVFSAQTGRIRLCAITDVAKMAGSLKCSVWQGGGEPGRYSMQQAYANVNAAGRVVVGTWVFSYSTGQVRACAASDVNDLAGTFSCSNAE